MALPTPAVPALADITTDANFKIVFGNKVIDLVPPRDPIYDGMLFSLKPRVVGGSQFQQAIEVSLPGTTQFAGTQDMLGPTWATTTGSPAFVQTAFASHQLTHTLITPMREIVYMSAGDPSADAFQNLSQRFDSFMKAAKLKVVMDLLYAGNDTGLARFDTGSNPGAGTTMTLTIADTDGSSQVAPGMFRYLIGNATASPLELDFATAAAPTVKLNSNATVKVTGFNTATNVLSVAGNNTDLVAIYNAGTVDVICRLAGQLGLDIAPGIDSLASLGSTGTYLGVAFGTYPRWQNNAAISVGGQLTFQAVNEGLMTVKSNGFVDGKATLLCSYKTWKRFVDNIMAIRGSNAGVEVVNTFKTGAGTVEQYFDRTMNCNYVPHPLIKESEAYLIWLKEWERGGAHGLVTKLPGVKLDEKSYTNYVDPDDPYIRWNAFNDSQAVTYTPSSVLKFTGIKNS